MWQVTSLDLDWSTGRQDRRKYDKEYPVYFRPGIRPRNEHWDLGFDVHRVTTGGTTPRDLVDGTDGLGCPTTRRAVQ